MRGFRAGLAWYWGEPFADPIQPKRPRQGIVRHHLILGGFPTEIFDHICTFLSTDIVTYKTPPYPDQPINLVIVLKCECKPHVSAFRQLNDCAGRDDHELVD